MRPIFTLLMAFAFHFSICQIPNSGFRNWTYVTDSFGFSTYIPSDTFSYVALDNWTSSNQLTGNPSTGGKILANQVFDATMGKYVVGLNTDSIYVAGTLNRGMIVPGFIVNGNFRFDLASIIFSNGGAVNPGQLAGAGSPISQRYDSIGALVKYMPITGDSLLLWAVLKKNGQVIASTKTYSTHASSTYTYVSGQFNYTSCEIPDTAVVMIASSNPNFSTLLSGASGLEPGSVLMLDSLILTHNSIYQNPIVNSYSVYTFENQTKRINILSGDTDCSGLTLTASIVSQPPHGTATLITSDTLLYTPNTGFTGIDTMFFSVSNGFRSSLGSLRVSVFRSTGFSDIQMQSFSLFPNPARNTIRVHTSEMQNCNIRVLDIAGREIIEKYISGQDLVLDISSLSPGIYFVKAGNAAMKFIKE